MAPFIKSFSEISIHDVPEDSISFNADALLKGIEHINQAERPRVHIL